MPAPEQAQKARALITAFIRLQGVFFLIAGPLLGFNAGGAATAIGLGHGDIGGIPTCQIIGGFAFVMGLSNYFVIPVILRRAWEKADKDTAASS